MIKKLSTAGSMIAVMGLSTALHATAFVPSAIADMPAIPESGMIEIVSKQESDLPGYYHTKYIFWHQTCQDSMPVDHYGPAINPHDSELLKQELKYCREKPDGESDSED